MNARIIQQWNPILVIWYLGGTFEHLSYGLIIQIATINQHLFYGSFHGDHSVFMGPVGNVTSGVNGSQKSCDAHLPVSERGRGVTRWNGDGERFCMCSVMTLHVHPKQFDGLLQAQLYSFPHLLENTGKCWQTKTAHYMVYNPQYAQKLVSQHWEFIHTLEQLAVLTGQTIHQPVAGCNLRWVCFSSVAL